MNSRQLGQQGFEVSEVGLGCWQLGSDWGSVSEESSLAILAGAIDNGVTFLDTADVYGNGLSETIIGQFLRQCQRPVKVATKFGRKDGIFPAGIPVGKIFLEENVAKVKLFSDPNQISFLNIVLTNTNEVESF